MKLIWFTSDKQNTKLGKPLAIKELIPEWYRTAESTYTGLDGAEQPGLKKCAPYLDIMIGGYALITPFDIYVSKDEKGDIKFAWQGPEEFANFVNERPKALGATMPRPAGHAPNHLVWASTWGFKVPRGYSVIVTHPFNRFDLPFTTTSGTIDSDVFWANGNMPFFIKEDFEGVIPAGTPYAQLMPFKRQRWMKIMDQSLVQEYYIQGTEVRKKGKSYKAKLWQRKEYK